MRRDEPTELTVTRHEQPLREASCTRPSRLASSASSGQAHSPFDATAATHSSSTPLPTLHSTPTLSLAPSPPTLGLRVEAELALTRHAAMATRSRGSKRSAQAAQLDSSNINGGENSSSSADSSNSSGGRVLRARVEGLSYAPQPKVTSAEKATAGVATAKLKQLQQKAKAKGVDADKACRSREAKRRETMRKQRERAATAAEAKAEAKKKAEK